MKTCTLLPGAITTSLALFLMIVELSGGIVLPVEVADLVAEGLTNHAIARRLSVAPRTAEAHVENIRRKLEVRSRAQIAAWVTEHRLRP